MSAGAEALRKPLAQVKETFRAVEDWWFDTRWNIDTAGDRHARQASDIVGAQRDGHVYAPARVRNIEAALDQLPITDPGSYTFIDLGSGKGRVVLLAATRPFKRVVGVEYSEALHRKAQENLQRFKGGASARARVDLELADAATFTFPPGDLVLHLFNPFGPEVMQHVLNNLQIALVQQTRKVFVVLLWPELSDMVENSPRMRLYHCNRRFAIFVAE